jgi:glucosamine 6-phosphate synthetase-like amidotransferase/phosphosugar isomerase protein
VGNPQGKLVQAGDVVLLDPGGVEHNGPKIRSYIVSCFQGLLLCLMIREIKTGASLIPQLSGLPEAAAQFIRDVEPKAKQVAGEWAKQVQSYMVAGSGSDAGNAIEIALKILETIPTPANGFDVEEYTHGPILSTKPDRALIVLQGTPEGKKRCVEAAYAASAVTDKIMVVTEDARAGWPEGAVVWQIPTGFSSAGFVLSPMPAQVLVYYLCLALGTNPDHASTASPQMAELYHRAFPPGMH